MSLLFRTFVLVLAGALSLPAAARSCYVSADTSGVVPPPWSPRSASNTTA